MRESMRLALTLCFLASAALAAERDPYTVHVPASYTGDAPVPLVIELHGNGSSGAQEERYLDLTEQSDLKGFILALPNGTKGADGKRYWNATDMCCSGGTNEPDDSAYLSGLIVELQAAYNINPKRVYFVGHSNGGYMAHRMACDHADQIAAVISLEGSTWKDQSHCTPSAPIAVLEIHGTADRVVKYDGQCFGQQHCYPGALETVENWALLNHCSSVPGTQSGTKDLMLAAGNETDTLAYGSCDTGGAATLWIVNGGTHIPPLSDGFNDAVARYLTAHAKP